MTKNVDRKIIEISLKHYKEWVDYENKPDSPSKWLFGSFATVRGLLRIPFDAGQTEYGNHLLALLKKDLEEFEQSLKDFPPQQSAGAKSQDASEVGKPSNPGPQ